MPARAVEGRRASRLLTFHPRRQRDAARRLRDPSRRIGPRPGANVELTWTSKRDDRDGHLATRRAHTSIMGRRDDRNELRCVAARTTGIKRRATPLGPAGRFAGSTWRATSSQRTRKAMPRSREAGEHGHRAHRPHGGSSTSPRMRPAGSRGAASTRTSRSHAHASTAMVVFATRSAHTSVMGRRDGRDELRRVAARTTGLKRRATALGPAGRFAARSRCISIMGRRDGRAGADDASLARRVASHHPPPRPRNNRLER